MYRRTVSRVVSVLAPGARAAETQRRHLYARELALPDRTLLRRAHVAMSAEGDEIRIVRKKARRVAIVLPVQVASACRPPRHPMLREEQRFARVVLQLLQHLFQPRHVLSVLVVRRATREMVEDERKTLHLLHLYRVPRLLEAFLPDGLPIAVEYRGSVADCVIWPGRPSLPFPSGKTLNHVSARSCNCCFRP